jgi:hypothetical protein
MDITQGKKCLSIGISFLCTLFQFSQIRIHPLRSFIPHKGYPEKEDDEADVYFA